jgi:predicted transcriptional regulator
VHLNPDLQAKLDKLATETGRPPDELVEDAVLGYLDELARTRETLDHRYDDLKSGSVQPIDGEEAFARLKPKTGPLEANRTSAPLQVLEPVCHWLNFGVKRSQSCGVASLAHFDGEAHLWNSVNRVVPTFLSCCVIHCLSSSVSTARF